MSHVVPLLNLEGPPSKSNPFNSTQVDVDAHGILCNMQGMLSDCYHREFSACGKGGPASCAPIAIAAKIKGLSTKVGGSQSIHTIEYEIIAMHSF